MATERSTDEQLTERKLIIRNMLSAGLSQADIVNKVREDYASWGVTDRMVRKYVAAVYEDFSKDAGLVDRRAWFMKILERMDHRSSSADSQGNHKLAQQCDNDIAKLLKLENPQANMKWRENLKAAGFEVSEAIAEYANMAFEEAAADEIQQ